MPIDNRLREVGGDGELRKVVTSEGLGIGDKRHLRQDSPHRRLSLELDFLEYSLAVRRAGHFHTGKTQRSSFNFSMMDLPPLSIEQFSQLAASNAAPSQLFEILSQYEPEATLMAAGAGNTEIGSADPQLLSMFYSSFFFAHLLTEQS